MKQIVLNHHYMLSAEPDGKKVRLIVSMANVEVVCRKETLKNLTSFLKETEAKIFKGRLQLHKQEDVIEVIVKKERIAVISAMEFEKLIS